MRMKPANFWITTQNNLPKYAPGDYLKLELASGQGKDAMSLWIYVDHCDDRHGIVFGTIDREPAGYFGRALRRGVRLAATYRQVREHRAKS